MDEMGFRDALVNLLDDELEGVRSIQNFEEFGMLTKDAGLVVRMQDGTEFQVTIVQSR